MNIAGVLMTAAIISMIGLVIGILLGIASEKLKVDVDQKELLVRAVLPGNNCGGCGYPGCDGLAKAIALGEAQVTACPVGGSVVADQIAAIMGVEGGVIEKMVAYVKCKGSGDHTTRYYHYYGSEDCNMAKSVPGMGGKACQYGCMGYGSCAKVCEFHALQVVNGVAVVEPERCVACGKCIASCPNQLIDLVPYKAKHLVGCDSQDKGKGVKEKCSVGCIGCSLCIRICNFDAIHMNGNVACIDYQKCTSCGACTKVCPTGIIQ